MALLEDISKIPSLWIQTFTKLDNMPYRFFSTDSKFTQRPFLKSIVDDKHPRRAIEKSRQLGLTETVLREALWWCCNHTVIAVYVIPLMAKVNEIGQTRISKVLDELDRDMYEMVKSKPWSNERRKFNVVWGGESYLLLQNALKHLGESTPIDFLILDEYDRVDNKVVSAFRAALTSSPAPTEIILSTPTFKGHGIDHDFSVSDQRYWMIKCNHCNYHQYLTWEKNVKQVKGDDNLIDKLRFIRNISIEPGTFIRVCSKCQKELDLEDIYINGNAYYVAKYPSRQEVRGYKVSQLSAPWVTPDKIASALRDAESLQEWYNYELGEPYEGDERTVRVSVSDIVKHMNFSEHLELYDLKNKYSVISVGIDWGTPNWILVLGRLKDSDEIHIIYLDYIKDEPSDPRVTSALDSVELAKNIKADVIISDYGYGSDRNPVVYDKFGGTFYSCRYKDSHNSVDPVWTMEKGLPVALINRTAHLKRILSMLKKGFIKCNAFSKELEDKYNIFVEHVESMVITTENKEVKKGHHSELEDVVLEANHNTHYVHALGYAYVGLLYFTDNATFYSLS